MEMWKIDNAWKALLRLRNLLLAEEEIREYYFLSMDSIAVDESVENSVLLASESFKGNSHFIIKENYNIEKGTLELNKLLSDFMEIYLPVCFYHFKARIHKKAIAVAHFAQTLDGRIATEGGDSKWIGNEENLIHAHRMRALCDGVLIGSGTLKSDKPRLSVRHVEGKNPSKIVVGNSEYDHNSLEAAGGKVIKILSENTKMPVSDTNTLLVDEKGGSMNCHTMLAKLYEKKVNSIYIEGGSFTSSEFLKQGALYSIQLHIAPIIVGTGIPSFSLPPVEKLSEALSFDEFEFYHVGREIMFCGKVHHL